MAQQFPLMVIILFVDSKDLEFTAALHTYLGVSDISKARVDGLQGLDLLDKVSFSSTTITLLTAAVSHASITVANNCFTNILLSYKTGSSGDGLLL